MCAVDLGSDGWWADHRDLAPLDGLVLEEQVDAAGVV